MKEELTLNQELARLGMRKVCRVHVNRDVFRIEDAGGTMHELSIDETWDLVRSRTGKEVRR